MNKIRFNNIYNCNIFYIRSDNITVIRQDVDFLFIYYQFHYKISEYIYLLKLGTAKVVVILLDRKSYNNLFATVTTSSFIKFVIKNSQIIAHIIHHNIFAGKIILSL